MRSLSTLAKISCAGKGATLSDPTFLGVLVCQALMQIPENLFQTLDPCAKDLIHVGYKPGSKSYCLGDPHTRKVVVSQDVTLNESFFPLRDPSIHQLPTKDEDCNDDPTFWSVSKDSCDTPHLATPTSSPPSPPDLPLPFPPATPPNFNSLVPALPPTRTS